MILVMSGLLKRFSYRALTAREATNEQSEMHVCFIEKQSIFCQKNNTQSTVR